MQGAEEQLVGKMNRRISLITGLDTSGTFTYPDDDDWIQVIVREAFKRKNRKYIQQAGTELGQAQLKLELELIFT